MGMYKTFTGRLQQRSYFAVAFVVAFSCFVERRFAIFITKVGIGAVPQQYLHNTWSAETSCRNVDKRECRLFHEFHLIIAKSTGRKRSVPLTHRVKLNAA